MVMHPLFNNFNYMHVHNYPIDWSPKYLIFWVNIESTLKCWFYRLVLTFNYFYSAQSDEPWNSIKDGSKCYFDIQSNNNHTCLLLTFNYFYSAQSDEPWNALKDGLKCYFDIQQNNNHAYCTKAIIWSWVYVLSYCSGSLCE